jgi:hypothetical protein
MIAEVITLLTCIPGCQVGISIGTRTILTEDSGFPESLQEDAMIVPLTRSQPFPFSFLAIHYSLTAAPFDSTYSEILTTPLK